MGKDALVNKVLVVASEGSYHINKYEVYVGNTNDADLFAADNLVMAVDNTAKATTAQLTSLVQGARGQYVAVRILETAGDTGLRAHEIAVYGEAAAEPAPVSEDLAMVEGASVRTDAATSGLRFTTMVSDAKIAALDADETVASYEFGTLMLPSRLLTGELTLDTPSVLKVAKGEDWYKSAEEGKRRMTAVLWGIPDAAYTDMIAARAYLTITYADGTTETVYSAFDAEKNVRCIKDVAQAAYDHREEINPAYTAEELTVLKLYAGITE